MLTQASPYFRHWYVVFTPQTEDAQWWHKLGCLGNRKKFGHVLLVRAVTDTHALFIDPKPDYCLKELLEFGEPVTEAMGKTAVDYPVLSLIAQPKSFWNPTCHIPSCVTLAKYIIGVNSMALTPKQLFTDLQKNHGATLI